MNNKLFYFQSIIIASIIFIISSCSQENPIQDNTLLETRGVTIQREPFEFIEYTCLEDIKITGEAQYVIKEDFTTPSGNTSFSLQINTKGTGVGLSTGAVYRFNDNLSYHAISRNENNDPNIVLKINARTIGQGSAPSFKWVSVYTIIYNANGEPTAVKIKDIIPECN